jgi:hypothetical protein
MRGRGIDGGFNGISQVHEVGQRRIGGIALPLRSKKALVTRRRSTALRCSAVPQDERADGILHHATVTQEVVSQEACNYLFSVSPPL